MECVAERRDGKYERKEISDRGHLRNISKQPMRAPRGREESGEKCCPKESQYCSKEILKLKRHTEPQATQTPVCLGTLY